MPKDLPYEAICLKVAKLLHEERRRRKLSLSAVAARAGLSYQMVGYVERSLRIPGLDTLLRITAALDLDPADLLKMAMVGTRQRHDSNR